MRPEHVESKSAPYSSKAVEMAEVRILVAEDQEDVVEALRLLLKNHGYAAEFVNNPADAIAALESSRFDGVLMDLNYTRDTTSGSEGLELLTQVQAIDSTLAVVVMTAWGSIELAVDALHRGACDFVQKPWDNAQLLKVLGEQLKRSRALRAARLEEQFEKQEATEIQRAMMAVETGNLTGLQIAVSFQPARGIAGDYYDVIALDDSRAGLCVADVAGKGVGAALLMSNLQAVVRTLAPQLFQPRELCSRVNQGVCANKIPGKFVTFFAVSLILQRTNSPTPMPGIIRQSSFVPGESTSG